MSRIILLSFCFFFFLCGQKESPDKSGHRRRMERIRRAGAPTPRRGQTSKPTQARS